MFDAFCRQAGVARCDTLAALCETLKLFHTGGPLGGRRVLIMGASGGDMAMTADVARALDLDFAAGIAVPIVPGIMPVTNFTRLKLMATVLSQPPRVGLSRSCAKF